MDTLESPLLTIGAGNMAHAILSGASCAGYLEDSRIAALDPNADRRGLFSTSFDSPQSAASWLAERHEARPIVLVAVKPQMLREALTPVVTELRDANISGCTFVSILAGTRADTIRSIISDTDRVIRVMPNTPAQLGLGMSAIGTDSTTNQVDLEIARALFQAIGETIEIAEDLMDAFTAVAGSGPAYLFYLAEGMMKAAESLGFDALQASIIVRQTLLGSAHLLSESLDSPSELRARVTSKNGTTFAATQTLDQHDVMQALVAALTSARDRGRELAAES